MAEIRSFQSRKRIRTEEKDIKTEDIDKKIQRHRQTVFYRIAIAIAIVVAVVAIFIVHEATKNYTSISITSEVNWSDNSGIDIIKLGDCLMTYNRDGAVCSDLNGDTVWNQTYEMQNPIVSVNGEYAAIADYNGTTVYVVNSTGLQGTISMSLPIRDLVVSEKGTVVAVVDDNPTTWLYMYSKEGAMLLAAKTSMADYGYPINLAISSDSKMMMVSYLSAVNGSLSTRVAFYNLQDVGDNYQDNLVSGFNYTDAIVPMVRFMTDVNSFAVADNRLMFFSGKEIPTSVKEMILIENLRDVVYSDKYVGVVYLNTEGGGKYKMDVYNTLGNNVRTYYFDRDYKEILFANDLVYIYNGSGIELYTMGGDLKFSGDFAESVTKIIPGRTKDKLTLISSRKIQTATLH
ncbi:MAG: hypothetical protein KBS85_04955 [Lachnospiraceae bacterium]|nr:hypothetical protein [Candidatus Merdinaster equi]